MMSCRQLKAPTARMLLQQMKQDWLLQRDHRMFGGFSMGGVTTWYQFCSSLKYVRYFYPASGSLYWGPDSQGKDTTFGGRFALNALTSQGYTKMTSTCT